MASIDIASFIHEGRATRVVFGAGSLGTLAAEVERLGCHRVLVLCTPHQHEAAEALTAQLGPLAAGVFAQATMHVPIAVAEAGIARAGEVRADGLVAFGGGSTIGLAKAIALRLALPIVAIPTTYAGSEMTPIYGITEGSVKTTGNDLRVLPKAVIYDPTLTLELPLNVSIASGINAIAHAAEGLYARDANPITSLMAEEGIRALGAALPRLVAQIDHAEARSAALYGAWLCGAVLGSVGMSLHHKLCHTLGGSFGLPHAETHSAVLPHALAYNFVAAPQAAARVARALGAPTAADAASAIHALAALGGASASLRAIGMNEADLDRATDLALLNPYWNPRPLERSAVRGLLQRAHDGERPLVDR